MERNKTEKCQGENGGRDRMVVSRTLGRRRSDRDVYSGIPCPRTSSEWFGDDRDFEMNERMATFFETTTEDDDE